MIPVTETTHNAKTNHKIAHRTAVGDCFHVSYGKVIIRLQNSLFCFIILNDPASMLSGLIRRILFVADTDQQDPCAEISDRIRVLLPEDLVDRRFRILIPFQFDDQCRGIGIMPWNVGNIGESLSRAQLLKLHILVTVGVVRQLDDTAQTILTVVMQRRRFLPVNLLDLGCHRFFIPVERVKEKLFTLLQALQRRLVADFFDRLGEFELDLLVRNPDCLVHRIVGKIAKMDHQCQDVIPAAKRGQIIGKASRAGHFTS